MARKVLIMGESGTGKTSSMINCNKDLTYIVNPVGKDLPFRIKFETLDFVTDSSAIVTCVKDAVKRGKKIIVIDDFQYILSVPYMNRIKEQGWDKWNDFSSNYFELIDMCNDLPDDVVVYYLTHTETLDNGITTVKLIGKQLREKITIEGLFTIVLKTQVVDGQYYFVTQNSGKDTVKSPIGMFGSYAINNDLNYVDDKIRNYYEMTDCKSDAEIAEADKAAENTEIQKPESGERRRRGGRRSDAPAQEKTEEDIRKEMDSITDEGIDCPFETETKEEQKPAQRTRRTRKER